ncbi:hypothetical protein [Deinococcus puniceus]|uniref:hypothetical protein n=1 Tax=Deinococcus puniceus TaxID=1182568 RepID=UPI0012F9AB75|nr:hypothetical protein [Deinococcus puniceus]
MSNDLNPVMTLENLRIHLLATRDQGRTKMAEEDVRAPSWAAGDVVARLLAKRLETEGVIRAQVWREAMFSPGGDNVRTLWFLLIWRSGESLEVCLPDHPQMEIMVGPPEDAKSPSGLNLCIALEGSENQAWGSLRLWGAELLPDPFQEDQNWRVASSC